MTVQKEAYYFPHFCNARHDRKIRRLTKELGIEGYGIFFMLLEVLREQLDFRYPLDDIDLLADEFNTSEQKVKVVISNYKLFEIDEQHKFFSPRLVVYMQPYLKMKEQRRKAGLASAAKRRELQDIERPLNDRDTTDEQSKVKESKVKDTTSSEYSEKFEQFWREYPKKKGKAKAFSSWKKFNCDNGIFESIMESLKSQKQSGEWAKHNGKYIPHGSSWVTGKMWEDETEVSTGGGQWY